MVIFSVRVFTVGIAIDNVLVLCVFICFIVGLCNLTLNWYNHGEPHVLNENIHDNEMSDGDHMDGIDALVGDRIRGEPRNAIEDEEVRHFDKFEEDAKRELYPSCTNYSILKFVIEMLNVKVMTNLSNKGLDMMLDC